MPERTPTTPRDLVLVVDDELDICRSLRMLLEEEVGNVEVEVHTSGQEALRFLADHEAALVLCDYRMPGMDGLEFLEHAWKLRPGLPAIMVTAFIDAIPQPTPDLPVYTKTMDLDEVVAAAKTALGRGQNTPVHPATDEHTGQAVP